MIHTVDARSLLHISLTRKRAGEEKRPAACPLVTD